MNISKFTTILTFFFVLGCYQASAQCALCPPDDDGCVTDANGDCIDPIDPIGGGGDDGGGNNGGGGSSSVPVATEESSKTTLSFNANWNAVTGATYYYLDVAEDSNFSNILSAYNNVEIAGTNAGGGGIQGPDGDPPPTVYSVLNLTPGKNYYYRVRAKDSGGTVSGNSNTITANTLINAPTALQENTRTNTSFKARWNGVSGAVSYRLDVATNNSFTSMVSGYNNKSVSNTSRTVSGLTPGKRYYYRVRAVGADITSSNSGNITANTTISAPTALEESNKGNQKFTANWQSVTGAVSYLLYVSEEDDFSTHLTNYDGYSVTGTSHELTGLTRGKKYYYKVKSVGSHYQSNGFSSSITANTYISKTIVAEETANTSDGFTANWSAVTGAETYLLYITTVSGDYSAANLVAGYDGASYTNTSANVTGLPSGKTFYYKVKSRGPDIASGYSLDEITAHTTIDPPATASASNQSTTGLTLNWDAHPDADSYLLQVSKVVDDFSSANLLAGYDDLSVASNSINLTGLEIGKSYSFRIKAVGTSETSAYSAPRTVTTIIDIPTATAASNPVADGFTANWDAVPGAQSYNLWVTSVSNDYGAGNVIDGYGPKSVTSNSEDVIGLFTGTQYYYKVQAVGEDISSLFSQQITANSAMQVPVVLEETNLSETSFTANWQPILGATAYTLQLSNVADFSVVLA
ncbi:fibronectin type III domain-containing protein [Ekhidna sp.]